MDDLKLIVRCLCEVRRADRALALFFDYDGTLAPIQPTPAQATLPAACYRALQHLTEDARMALGIVSGRALDDLRSMVDLDGVYYAGTSGLEIDFRKEQRTMPESSEIEQLLAEISGVARPVAEAYPGAWLERKPLGLTLHYRAVERAAAGRLRLDAVEALAPWLERVRVDDVTLGIEIVPKIGRDKGTAVREILADIAGRPFPVYFGDAINDAPAMTVVDELGGLSVGVGPAPPKSAMRLDGPEAVEALLVMLSNEFCAVQPVTA